MTAGTLTDLAQRWREIEHRLDQSGGEITAEIEVLLAEFNLDEADKVDGYVHVIRDLRDRADLSRSQAKYLEARGGTLDARADWLEQRLAEHMAARGLRRLEGHVRRAQYQRNGGSEPIEVTVAPEVLPERYQRVKVTANVQVIRDALDGVGSTDAPGVKADVLLDDEGRVIARRLPRGETLRLY